MSTTDVSPITLTLETCLVSGEIFTGESNEDLLLVGRSRERYNLTLCFCTVTKVSTLFGIVLDDGFLEVQVITGYWEPLVYRTCLNQYLLHLALLVCPRIYANNLCFNTNIIAFKDVFICSLWTESQRCTDICFWCTKVDQNWISLDSSNISTRRLWYFYKCLWGQHHQ